MRFVWFVIGAIVLLVLITVFFLGFNRPSSDSGNGATDRKVTLSSYANSDVIVSFTSNGIINGSEDHRAIKITITKNSRMLEILSGYQGSVMQSNSFTNNSAAYKEFLASLQTLGYLNERKITGSTSIEGQCPLGVKYIFNTTNVTSVPATLWTTSCPTSKGNYGGSLSSTQRLFRLQIPNYNSLTSGISLN